MKRVWPAWLFLFLGAFFLVTAGIAQFWATDAAERTPLNSYQRTYLTGTADVLDPTTGKTNHDQVKITNITQVDDEKSTGERRRVRDLHLREQRHRRPRRLPAEVGPADDQCHPAQLRRRPAHRRGLRRPEVSSSPRVPVSGLVNKWPFHAEKKSYDVWDDVTQDRRRRPTYVGETTMRRPEGATSTTRSSPTPPIDLGNDIQGIYNLDETYSIDPVTGKIIDQQVHDVRTLKDGGATALDLTARVHARDHHSPTSTTPRPAAKQLNADHQDAADRRARGRADLPGARRLPAASGARRTRASTETPPTPRGHASTG